MELNREYIYRDKNSLSPRATKIFGRFVLYSYLFLIASPRII